MHVPKYLKAGATVRIRSGTVYSEIEPYNADVWWGNTDIRHVLFDIRNITAISLKGEWVEVVVDEWWRVKRKKSE